MSIHEEAWAAGTPAWVELIVPDRHRARGFYGQLFGWDFDEGTPETGYYANALKGGQRVAGIGEPMPGQQQSPPAWMSYLATDDVDATTARVAAAGGQVLVEPMDVMELGRMAVAADPTGAVFGLWQSRTHTGANLVDEPGSVTWTEVMTRDYPAARKFYGSVFGYQFGERSGNGFSYATLEIDGQPVGGIGQLPADTPQQVPAHWRSYLAVDDTDGTVAKVTELGGTVQQEPWDTEFGRISMVAGPVGESFGVMSPTR